MMDNKNENKENKIGLTFAPDFSGKVLFMRHGETVFNRSKEFNKSTNPEYNDAHLSEDGIKQIISIQEEINKLSFERVYVSPYYRALQTVSIALERHPALKDLTVYVHPKISEVVCGTHDFIKVIKQTKKDFNMESKVKVDWSYFDKYIKEKNLDENFFYFENIDRIDEKAKSEIYSKLTKLYYEQESKDEYKKELEKFYKESRKNFRRFESLQHAYNRFKDFKSFLKEEHKETINDDKNKILCVSHSTFINTAIDPDVIEAEKNKKNSSKAYDIKNGEIISVFI